MNITIPRQDQYAYNALINALPVLQLLLTVHNVLLQEKCYQIVIAKLDIMNQTRFYVKNVTLTAQNVQEEIKINVRVVKVIELNIKQMVQIVSAFVKMDFMKLLNMIVHNACKNVKLV